ncbi:hypothetical protein GQ44DRAFT_714882 [Phaeosphaeriaceae sp. PMI808]|nr:hypothetical protein GQ44DRAFT_714882 [Phaeosphaeriaceae sp. PMI808]
MHPYNPPSIRSIISVDTRCPNSTLDYEIGAPDDLAWFTALSLEQYTAACGQYNARHSGETNQCVGIVLNGDVAETRKKDCGASCWLKNSTSTRSKKKGFTIVKAEVQS